jgi:hypothetical protein
MNRSGLNIMEITVGLAQFGERYHAIDLFADDVQEVEQLRSGEFPAGLTPIDPEGRRFHIQLGEKNPHQLEIYPDTGRTRVMHGFARTENENDFNLDSAHGYSGDIAQTAIKTALLRKGNCWPSGLVLALLNGHAIGAGPQSARRVCAISFDPKRRNWNAYDGGLLRWMKNELTFPMCSHF